MSYISENKQSFGLVAKDYKKYRGEYNAELYERIFSLVRKNQKELSILDLGCGVGNSTEPMIRIANKLRIKASIIGCDPDKQMLDQGRLSAKKNKLPIKYIEGKAEELPFLKEQFDIIISGAAFHWFATSKAMKEINRVLKNKGIFFVFWTQNLNNQVTIGQDLYQKYKWQGIPQKLRDPLYVKNILIKNGLQKVKIIKIPHVESKTITETIGLIKTNSTYALLSDSDKKIFINAMTREYKKAFGKNKIIVEQEINICYGFK